MKNNIAIIPARYGSKRISKKNIKLFNGEPMISWSIKKALASKLFKQVVVTTDSQEIANIANKYGATTPFTRSKKLSDDHTIIVDVIADAIEKLKELNISADNICCIFPCTPLMLEKDLKKAYAVFRKSKSNFTFPVTEYSHPIQRALKLDKSKKIKAIDKKNYLKRSQDFQKRFYDIGCFYWGKSHIWQKKVDVFKNSTSIQIPNWRTVDIDSIDDWKRAELIFKLLNNT